MFRPPELKESPFLSEAPPKEWELAATDEITNAFYVANRIILCIEDEKHRHHLKIIKNQEVRSIPIPFPCTLRKIMAYSNNLLLCIGDLGFGCALFDLNKNTFISKMDLPISSNIIGFLKSTDQEDILVIHTETLGKNPPKESSLAKKISDLAGEVKIFFERDSLLEKISDCILTLYPQRTLAFYKFDKLSSQMQLINTIDTKFSKVAIDCDGQHLLCSEQNSGYSRYRVNKNGRLDSVFFCKGIPANFEFDKVNIAIPNSRYIQRCLRKEKDAHNPTYLLQILDKNFKAIASCLLPINTIKKIHALSDRRTFVAEFYEHRQSYLTTSLGILKLTNMGELNMTLHQLPHPVKNIIVDESETQLICLHGKNNKVAVINNFAPLLDFVAIDKELDRGTGEKFPAPLRKMMTGYLGS